MLQDGTFVHFVETQNITCQHRLKNGELCGCKLRVTDTSHAQTVGIFTLTCDATVNVLNTTRDKTRRHDVIWKTQFPNDGNYALNRRVMTAEVLSGGSIRQLEQRHSILKMKPICPNYWNTQMKRLDETIQELAKHEIDANFDVFANRPIAQRIVELDGRHATPTGRGQEEGSMQTTFEVLEKPPGGTEQSDQGRWHQIIFLLNVHTREDKTGKAVKNEGYAFRKFLQQCMDRNIELYMVCHDDCSEATGLIKWYNSIMRARAAQQNREYVDCIDARDCWHGKKNHSKAWNKHMELHARPKYKKVVGKVAEADSQLIQNRKEIALRQLKHPAVKPCAMSD